MAEAIVEFRHLWIEGYTVSAIVVVEGDVQERHMRSNMIANPSLTADHVAAIDGLRKFFTDGARKLYAVEDITPAPEVPTVPEVPPTTDPPDLDTREITILGTGEIAEYLLTVTGEILSAIYDPVRGITIDATDTIAADRKNARGTVSTGKDGYRFTGEYTLQWLSGTGTVTEVL